MIRRLRADACPDLTARIYPTFEAAGGGDLVTPPPRCRDVGVCFSGGGSRSLSAVMGQLRGLRERGWLDRVAHISAVSGGCWASALFSFLPEAITYDEFLGTGVPPDQLTWDGGDDPRSLSHLSFNSLGRVPTRLGWDAIYQIYRSLRDQGFRDWNELWRIVIGELVFRAYGLYRPDANHNPTHFYAWSEDDFRRSILPFNPNLAASDFHFARNRWPALIMNGAMFYPPNVNSLIPVISTPSAAGIRAVFPQGGQRGPKAGGGFVDALGFGSRYIGRTAVPDRVAVRQARRFSLVDMVSISSAAFAEAFRHRFALQALELEYLYWPVAGVGMPARTYTFADGGLLDGTGLINLLANTDLERAVVFVNSSQRVEKDRVDPECIRVPGSIPPMFGFQPLRGVPDPGGYVPYAGDPRPKFSLMRHNQIFPSGRFGELLNGLGEAARKFEGTAMYLQLDLPLLDNPWYGLVGGRRVDVLWVCNNRVNAWERQITDPAILEYLERRDIPESPLWNFPYYLTLAQLNLTARQVNMLAQLSWWNVTADRNRDAWNALFERR